MRLINCYDMYSWHIYGIKPTDTKYLIISHLRRLTLCTKALRHRNTASKSCWTQWSPERLICSFALLIQHIFFSGKASLISCHRQVLVSRINRCQICESSLVLLSCDRKRSTDIPNDHQIHFINTFMYLLTLRTLWEKTFTQLWIIYLVNELIDVIINLKT